MDEATRSLLRQLTPKQRFAVAVEARRQAINAIKLKLRAQGLRPQHITRGEIVLMAERYLAEHREQFLCAALERIAQRGTD